MRGLAYWLEIDTWSTSEECKRRKETRPMLLPPRMGPWLELCEIRHSREISSVIVIVIVCEKRPWILINNTQNKLYRTCKVVPEWSIVTRKAGNWRGARSRLTVHATLGTEALPYTTPPAESWFSIMQYLPRRQPFFVPFEHWALFTSWEPDDRITFLAAHLNDSPGNLCPWWDWSKFAVRQLQWDTYFKPIRSNIFYFNVYGQIKKSITRYCLNNPSLKERWCTRETIHNIDKRQNIDRATRKRGRERQERLCLPNSTS